MPRLVNADKVAEAIAWLDIYDFALWHDVQECIDKVPTVDAVEVIRCKDCKHYTEHPSGFGCCEIHKGSIAIQTPFTFCAWGET